jgi:hypothetical protein
MYVDYPCGVTIQGSALHSYPSQFIYDLNKKNKPIKDLIVLISVWPPHAKGGGCFSESINNDEDIYFNGYRIS